MAASLRLAIFLAGALMAPAGALGETVAFDSTEIRLIDSIRWKGAHPSDPTNRWSQDARARKLGEILFFSKALSGDGRFSCADCHRPELGWTDGRPVAQGVAAGSRNTPSLLNAGFHRWLFWDGRANTLWSQALKPIENPLEMGGSRVSAICAVWGDEPTKAAYEALFGLVPSELRARLCGRGPATRGDASAAASSEIDRHFANVGKAIAAFVGNIVSAGSPFDRFAAHLVDTGEASSDLMSIPAQRGLKLFVGKAGCMNCHHSPILSDGEFHNTLVPPASGRYSDDLGRYQGVTALLSDQFRADGEFSDDRASEPSTILAYLRRNPAMVGQFRTPSLRNVARTAPYMHAGQLRTLREVVRFYSTMEGALRADHHQEWILQPLNLGESEIDDMVAFLEALSEPIRGPIPESESSSAR